MAFSHNHLIVVHLQEQGSCLGIVSSIDPSQVDECTLWTNPWISIIGSQMLDISNSCLCILSCLRGHIKTWSWDAIRGSIRKSGSPWGNQNICSEGRESVHSNVRLSASSMCRTIIQANKYTHSLHENEDKLMSKPLTQESSPMQSRTMLLT